MNRHREISHNQDFLGARGCTSMSRALYVKLTPNRPTSVLSKWAAKQENIQSPARVFLDFPSVCTAGQPFTAPASAAARSTCRRVLLLSASGGAGPWQTVPTALAANWIPSPCRERRAG